MKKKVWMSCICLLVGIFLLPMAVHADIGPKPSVNIKFRGIENEIYYITLLSTQKSTGPYSVSTRPLEEDSSLVAENKQEGLAAWKAFRSYADNDGFHFIEYFKRCNSENTFCWGYYPPATFKILLYFPLDSTFVVSDPQERYAFDSYYTLDVSDHHAGLTVQKSYDYTQEITSLIVRVLATIAIEVFVALLFGLRQKNLLLFITAVNCATQITLNVLLNVINYSGGSLAFVFHYVWMELVIVLLEGIAFTLYFKQAKAAKPIPRWIAPIYALVANAASFGLGLFISIQLPGVF